MFITTRHLFYLKHKLFNIFQIIEILLHILKLIKHILYFIVVDFNKLKKIT